MKGSFIIKVKKYYLLLIAFFVWSIAGFNVAIIGFNLYSKYLNIFNFVLSFIIFFIFQQFIFYRMVQKHTNRIINYEEENQYFFKFFDIKSFLIMFFMIALGVSIREFNLAPEKFIAIFYSGLGTALFLSGVLFGYNFFKFKSK